MNDDLAANQPEQPTAAPTQAESAPAPAEAKPVEKPVSPDQEPEWFVKRIGEFTARMRSEERRAQAAEQELFNLRAQLQQQPKVDEKPKTLADFEYDEGKFQAYIIDTAKKHAETVARQVRVEEQTKEQAVRSLRKFNEREAAFERDTPDYRDVAYTAPISNDVADIIRDLESGPELAYYLGKNREIALHLSDLPPRIAAVELGRIDAKLSAEKAAKAAALEAARKAKAVTNAPAPAPKLDGNDAAPKISSTDPDSYKLTDEEWVRAETARMKRKQQRA
jgi:hypothetical protein